MQMKESSSVDKKKETENETEKIIKIIFLMVLLASLLFCTLVSLSRKSRKRSIEENRNLAQWEMPTVHSVADGTWESGFEAWLKDQFAFRSKMIKMYYFFLDSQGMIERNDYVLGEEEIVLKVQPSVVKDLKAAAKFGEKQVRVMITLQEIADEYGGKVIYLNVPHHQEYFDDYYPVGYQHWTENYNIMRESIVSKAKAAGIRVVETYGILMSHKDEYIYFYTDNHWTQKGAYYAYQELLRAIGEIEGIKLDYPVWDEMNVVVKKERMFGSYLKQLGVGLRKGPDYVEYAIPDDMPEYTRYDNDKKVNKKLFDTSKNGYSLFMGGNFGNTKVETNRPDLPSILYIGHSYTNALEAMSVYNFNRMESIDVRHWHKEARKYILESKPDYIVIVRDDVTPDDIKME